MAITLTPAEFIQTNRESAETRVLAARKAIGDTPALALVSYGPIETLIAREAAYAVWHDVQAVFDHNMERLAEDPAPVADWEKVALGATRAYLTEQLADFHQPTSTSVVANQIDVARFTAIQDVRRVLRQNR